MSKPRKSPSVNENWIRQETKDEYKKAAEKTLAECKKYESEKTINSSDAYYVCFGRCICSEQH